MKRVALFTILALVLSYVIYILMAFTVNYEKTYNHFRKELAKAGYNIKASDINIERFPMPRIEVRNIRLDDVLTVKKLEIKFTPFSTILLNPEVDIIEISNVKIYTKDSRFDFYSQSRIMPEVISLLAKLPKMRAKDVTFVDIITKDSSAVEELIVDSQAPGNQLTLNWEKGSVTKLSYNILDGSVNVQTNHSSNAYDIKLSQIFKKSKLHNGTLRVNIKNLEEFMANNYRDVDLLVTKIGSKENVDLTAKFRVDADRIRFTDLYAKSKSIDMKGSIDLYNSNAPDRINLVFDYLDLTELLDKPNMDNVKESRSSELLSLNKVVRDINVTAKNINFFGGSLKDFNMNASIKNNKMILSEFSGQIGQDEGDFSAKGVITQNQYRSLFDGKIHVKHKDLNMILNELGLNEYASRQETNFVLESDFKATPIDYKMNNLFLKIGSFNSRGNADVKLIGSRPRLNVALSFSALDLFDKNIPVMKNFVEYFNGLTEDMKSQTYLNKFIPLREIDYYGNFDFTFNNIMVNNNQIDKIRIISSLSKGNILVHSLYYQDEGSYLTSVGLLNATSIKPKLEFRVDESYLITDKFTPVNIFSSLQKMHNNYDLNKITIDADVNAQTIKQGDKEFKNFRIKTANNGILWNIESLKASYAEGDFTSSGSLRMDAMNLSLAYAYNDFNIKKVFDILPFNIFGIRDGWMSTNGMISTNGKSLAELLYNLYLKSAFLAKEVKWDNFNIDGFVTHTSNGEYDQSKLQKDATDYMNKPKTIMNFLDGELELNTGNFKIFDVDFETDKSSGKADAHYNMYDTSLSINTNFMLKPPSTNIYNSRLEVSLPVKVTGKLLDTKKEFDFTDFKKYLDRKARSSKWIKQQQSPPQIIDQSAVRAR